MRIAAVVLAAGLSSRMKFFKPMLELAGSTVIKKTIETLRLAAVAEIVVVTGYQGEQLAKHLVGEDVTIVCNHEYQQGDMLSSAKLGLAAAQHNCDAVLLLPADIPLFSQQTIAALCSSMTNDPCDVVSPMCNGKKGHPILINCNIVDRLLAFSGENGLKGAIATLGFNQRLVEVDDRGVLLDADHPEDYLCLQRYAAEMARQSPVTLALSVELARGQVFWNNRLVELLTSIEHTNSLNKSCELLGISYSKAWGMVKQAQHLLGVPLLNTTTGGANGGGSSVTPEARMVIEAFAELQRELGECADKLFTKHFGQLFSYSEL